MSDPRPSSKDESPWLRRKRYMDKWDIGSTTVWKWEKEGRIEVMRSGKLVYIRDRPPAPNHSQHGGK
jgi:hypothetical protein